MNNYDHRTAVTELVEGVLRLIRTLHEDQRDSGEIQTVLGLCEAALKAGTVQDEAIAAPIVQTRPRDHGLRIAWLRAQGFGIRAISRRLGVHASTVSRRLRRT